MEHVYNFFLVFVVFPRLGIGLESKFYTISLFVSVLTILIILFSFEINLDAISDDNYEFDTNIHNLNLKNEKELIDYYKEEKPIQFQYKGKEIQIPVSFLLKFDRGVSLDTFKVRNTHKEYKLPDQLLRSRIRIMNKMKNMNRKGFYPYDKIPIIRFIEKRQKRGNIKYEFNVSKATLADEYATIQNPDDDLSILNTTLKNSPRNILTPSPKLPEVIREVDKDCYSNIPYRIAMHSLIITADGYILLQKRSAKRVATSPNEITSSAGGGMDWKDCKYFKTNAIKRFVYREISEETSLRKKEIKFLKVNSIIREFRRLGQPVIILTGHTTLNYYEIQMRWEKSRRYARNSWIYPYWYLWTYILGKSGREYWEMEFLIPAKEDDILNLLLDTNVQPPTKVALYHILEQIKK